MKINIYCGNPDCRNIILEEKFYFQELFGEFYHAGDCGTIAAAYHSFESGKAFSGIELKPINKDEALKLIASGKIRNLERDIA